MPEDLAETRFTLARALWDTPADQGRDRERALALASLARTALAELGEDSRQELEEVETWQREHVEGG